jgi:hypothetical protein
MNVVYRYLMEMQTQLNEIIKVLKEIRDAMKEGAK